MKTAVPNNGLYFALLRVNECPFLVVKPNVSLQESWK